MHGGLIYQLKVFKGKTVISQNYVVKLSWEFPVKPDGF